MQKAPTYLTKMVKNISITLVVGDQMILGHGHPEVVEAVKGACDLGFSFGTPTKLESVLAKQVMEMLPSMDMIRFVSSGTEACMSALSSSTRLHRKRKNNQI